MPDIDLRDRPVDAQRQELFEALAEAEAGTEFDVVADSDIDTHLLRYQIERSRAVDWEYEHPDAEPRRVLVNVGSDLGEDDRATIDVRDLKPQRRHQVLLQAVDELNPEEGFVLVNDHDPKPLYHELRSLHGDVIEWEYRNRGSEEWRVEIVKAAPSEAADDDVITRYDVRDIPTEERHPTIHHRYGMIPEGETMEIVAPHEPRPLRREFRQRYGDSFAWEVVESEPGRCRVRITKQGETEEDAHAAGADESVARTGNGEAIELTDELDVRERPPAQRHELIFEAYADLDPGEGFVLVNDHDPKPLYHQFEAEAGPGFRWEYRLEEPGEFRVLIGKADAPVDDATEPEPGAPF